VRPTRDSSGASRPSSLFGLAPGGVCHATPVTGSPVRSYRTISPLPDPSCEGHRRCAFCCTFHRLSPSGRYPAPCPMELGLSSDGSRPSRTAGDLHSRVPAGSHMENLNGA